MIGMTTLGNLAVLRPGVERGRASSDDSNGGHTEPCQPFPPLLPIEQRLPR